MGSPFTIRLQNQCGLGVLDAALIDKQLRLLPSFPPGSTVCDGSDASENVRIIVSGLAYRCRMTPEGGRHISAFLLPGDACDVSTLYIRSSGHSVVAASRCEAAIIPCRTLMRLVDDHPTIMRAMWILSLLDEAMVSEMAFGMGRQNAQGRMARLFCILHARHDQVGGTVDGDFTFPVTQIVVGDALGLSPVHTNRTLSVLKRMGLLEFHGGQVRITDVNRLRRFARFDLSHLSVDRLRMIGMTPSRGLVEPPARPRLALN